MIKHVVFWRLKNTADGSGEKIKEQLENLRGKIDGLIDIEVGMDLSKTPASYDIALYSTCHSPEALEAYQNHPLHVAVKQFIATAVTERVVVDYEV